MYYKLPTSSTLAREVQALLIFLAYALVRLSVLVYINKTSGIGVSLHPLVGFRIVNLRTFPYSTIAVSVSDLSILSHVYNFWLASNLILRRLCLPQGINFVVIQIFLLLQPKLFIRPRKYISTIRSFIP